jgi:hypothetical protein
LVLQELRYTESQEQQKMMESGGLADVDDPDAMETEADTSAMEAESSDVDEQWAAVVEPVTKDTLVDTAVAQLETLATLCGLLSLDPGSALAWVEEYSYDLLRTKIAAYVEGTTRHQEVGVARGKFLAALSEVLYRSGRIDMETYQREIGNAFPAELDLSDNAEGLCAKAEALTTLNAAVADFPPNADAAASRPLDIRWQALTAALDALVTAAKLAHTEDAPKVHIARGDAELSRWRLGAVPWNYAVAQQNASTLLQNAETYYRGAAGLARRDGAADEEREGACKEAIVAALRGDSAKLDELKSKASQDLTSVAEDMVEDGLVRMEDIEPLIASDKSH